MRTRPAIASGTKFVSVGSHQNCQPPISPLDARDCDSISATLLKQDWAQLFLEVVAKNAAHCCSTFVPPHFGHLTLLLSCSVTVKMVENFFSQDLQRYSYWGMAPSSARRFFPE
jgi:hypothetical protein